MPDYKLNLCRTCMQMTNHLGGVCQKCKPDTPQDSRGELESKLVDIFFRAAGGVSNMAEEEVAAILPAIDAYVTEQVAAALDLFQKDMAGYDFTPEEIRENTNALVADAVENSKAYVLKQLTPHGDKEIE